MIEEIYLHLLKPGDLFMWKIFVLSGNMNNCHLETGLYTQSKNAHWIMSADP